MRVLQKLSGWKQQRLSVLTAEYILLYSNSIRSHRVTPNTCMLLCPQGSYDSHRLAPSAGKLRLGSDSGCSPPTSSLGHMDMTGSQTVSASFPTVWQNYPMALHALELSLCVPVLSCTTFLCHWCSTQKNPHMAHKRPLPCVQNTSRNHDWGRERDILENLGCTASIIGK